MFLSHLSLAVALCSNPHDIDNMKLHSHRSKVTPPAFEGSALQHTFVYRGRKVEPLRGLSLAPVLSGKSSIAREDDTAVSWELFGMRAVRKGDYKLLWLVEPFGPDNWQLYNLANDPGETVDLSSQMPELRGDMIDIWNRYSQETGVILPSRNLFVP